MDKFESETFKQLIGGSTASSACSMQGYKNELISGMLSFKDKIGMWEIVLNRITDADFVIGYGFDNNEKLWKVYQNNERGMKAEWTFENEEEALEKLYKKVKFQSKIIN